MTDRQNKLLEKIRDLSLEMKLEVRDLSSENDAYTTGKISDYQFWLYDNGDVNFSSDWYDRRFEVYDFKTEEELTSVFISSLKKAIEQKEYYRLHPDKSPAPLLNRLFSWFQRFWGDSKR